jgi:hypothetical protein
MRDLGSEPTGLWTRKGFVFDEIDPTYHTKSVGYPVGAENLVQVSRPEWHALDASANARRTIRAASTEVAALESRLGRVDSQDRHSLTARPLELASPLARRSFEQISPKPPVIRRVALESKGVLRFADARCGPSPGEALLVAPYSMELPWADWIQRNAPGSDGAAPS